MPAEVFRNFYLSTLSDSETVFNPIYNISSHVSFQDFSFYSLSSQHLSSTFPFS